MDPASAKGYVPLCLEHLNEEILVLLGAGNDTTSNAMILGIVSYLSKAQNPAATGSGA